MFDVITCKVLTYFIFLNVGYIFDTKWWLLCDVFTLWWQLLFICPVHMSKVLHLIAWLWILDNNVFVTITFQWRKEGSGSHYLYNNRCTTAPPSDWHPSQRQRRWSPSVVLSAPQSLETERDSSWGSVTAAQIVSQRHWKLPDKWYSLPCSGCGLASGETLSLLVLWPAGGLGGLGASELIDWVTTMGLVRFLISHCHGNPGEDLYVSYAVTTLHAWTRDRWTG